MAERFFGRGFPFIEKFKEYKVEYWSYKKSSAIQYDDVIYQIGAMFPPGLDETYGLDKTHLMGSKELINDFMNRAELSKIKGISIGGLFPERPSFSYLRDYDYPYSYEKLTRRGEEVFYSFCETLIQHRNDLISLDCLILGNYIMDEFSHVFYDFLKVLTGYPTENILDKIVKSFQNLNHLLVRGGFRESGSYHLFKNVQPVINDNLKTLIIQSFGITSGWLRHILQYDLPQLEHLEIYIGTDFFGGTDDVNLLIPLFSGDLFPKLKYLGLKDSDVADEIAHEIVNSPIMDQLEVLDISESALTDKGGEILLNSPKVKSLKLLDLSRNHCSEDFVTRANEFSNRYDINIDITRQRGPLQRRYHGI